MSDGRFRRHGERREWVFADEACLAATCLDPIVVIERAGKHSPAEYCTCRTKLRSGCPGAGKRVFDNKQLDRLSKEFVKA